MIIHENEEYRRQSRINRKIKEHEKEQDKALKDIENYQNDVIYYDGTDNHEKANEARERLKLARLGDKFHGMSIGSLMDQKRDKK